MTFDDWMRYVDAALLASCYMTSRDLPDCPYRDWYDDGLTPSRAAKRAIKAAGG